MVMKSNDRILKLEKIDPKGKTDMVDPQVFEGKNNLHAVMDTSNCMWTCRYEHGLPPEPLRQRFTDFKTLYQHAERYFSLKNIKIVEVLD